jgi:tetratricopeptide (TPR) repeat protein
MRKIALLIGLLAAATPAPARPSAAVTPLMRAYVAQRSGDLDGALEAFLEALEIDPDSVAIRLEAARILGSKKRYDEALTLAEAGIGRRREDPQLHLLKARLLEILGRLEDAAAAAQEAAETGAGNDAYLLAVRLLERLDRHEEALATAGLWAQASPDSPEPHFARGRILARRGDSDQARQSLGRALQIDPNHRVSLRVMAGIEDQAGNLGVAGTLYRRVIAANPHDVESRFRLGQILVKQDRVDEAVKVFEAAERWGGSDPALRIRLGVLLLQADRAADAEDVFRAMARTNSGDTQARYLLGVALLSQEKHEEALDAFSRIPEGSPEYSDAVVRRAIALEGLGREDEAQGLLEDWLVDHPDDEEVLVALAGLREGEGDYRAAADLLESYLARQSTANARVLFTLGVLYDKLKDWRESAEYMKRSLELEPDDPHALNYLGYTYAEHGVYLDEAERLILRALELKPDDGFITDSLGWVYHKQGRYKEAEETLRKAVERAPDDPVIWEHLGDTLRALGDTQAAREAYEKTLEVSPETESARRKLEELR